jgi:hypothetical protein
VQNRLVIHYFNNATNLSTAHQSRTPTADTVCMSQSRRGLVTYGNHDREP